jgi:hypothetical protein
MGSRGRLSGEGAIPRPYTSLTGLSTVTLQFTTLFRNREMNAGLLNDGQKTRQLVA